MNRRKAIRQVALLVGGTLSSSTMIALYTACNPSGKETSDHDINQPSSNLFSDHYKNLLEEIAETILPKTGSPGAKEAQVSDFIQKMVQDCYSKEDQDMIINGLSNFEKDCLKSYQKSFLNLSKSDKESYLLSIEKEVFKNKIAPSHKIADDHTTSTEKQAKMETRQIDPVNKVPEPPIAEPNKYYRILKELTLLGYFTSELGATKALEYVKVPGKYMGIMPLKPAQKSWATS
jgi:hypothetical protein